MRITDFLFAITPLVICFGVTLSHRDASLFSPEKDSMRFRWYVVVVGILLSCGVFWGSYMLLFVVESVALGSDTTSQATEFFLYWGIGSFLTLLVNRLSYAKLREGKPQWDRFVFRSCMLLFIVIAIVLGLGIYFVTDSMFLPSRA